MSVCPSSASILYFIEKHNWITNSFVDNANASQDFTSLEAEQFIDLSSDLTLKSLYNLNLLISLVKARSKFPIVGCKALRVLVPFVTSHLCEVGSSAIAVIKSKYRNKIDIERDMCVAISNIAPRFNKLCIEQQAHCLHKMFFSIFQIMLTFLCILNDEHDI